MNDGHIDKNQYVNEIFQYSIWQTAAQEAINDYCISSRWV